MKRDPSYEHGLLLVVSTLDSRRPGRVHAPRWWDLVAHVVWLWARYRGRTAIVTMTNGEIAVRF